MPTLEICMHRDTYLPHRYRKKYVSVVYEEYSVQRLANKYRTISPGSVPHTTAIDNEPKGFTIYQQSSSVKCPQLKCCE